MVVGLIVGAIIALFCFISGYYLGVKGYYVGLKELDLSNDFVDHFIDIANPKLEPEIQHEATQNKAADLFRTSKGLLSYKKYVRSE